MNAATGELAGSLVSDALTLGLAVAVGAYLGARRDLSRRCAVRAEQAEAELALRSDQARLAERTRIAQEMHDVLAHRISLIGLHAGGLEVRPDAGPEVVERSATLIRETARAALEDLRGVLGVLRADASAEGADLAPQPQLQRSAAARRVVRRGGSRRDAALDVPEPAAAAPPEVTGRTVYRVVQEALTNVHKHARGASDEGAWSTVSRERGWPSRSSTCGRWRQTSLLPGAGFGLVGLRERVALAGGTLEAGPTPDGRLAGASLVPVADSVTHSPLGPVRVLLVDDDALVRAGLRMILSSADDLDVVGEAGDGAEVVEAVRAHRPDVVLMDIRMPRRRRARRDGARVDRPARPAARRRADDVRARRVRVPGARGRGRAGSCSRTRRRAS